MALLTASPARAARKPAQALPLSAPPPILDDLAGRLERNLKNSKHSSVAIFEFPHLDGKDSPGAALAAGELASSLSRRGFKVFSGVEIDSAAAAAGLLMTSRVVRPETARLLAKNLSAQTFVLGSLKDSGKRKVEVHALLYEASSAKIIGGGAQTIAKAWKEAAGECGKLNLVRSSTAAFAPEGTAANISILFTDPWWPALKTGSITWDFCKDKGGPPNLNDALPELKDAAWKAGGKTLVIEDQSRMEENPKLLKIRASVFR